MKKQWEKKVDTLISEYDQKILDKLNETGYQDVLSMIEGLQEELSALKAIIETCQSVISDNVKIV
jgi:hypothetical protein